MKAVKDEKPKKDSRIGIHLCDTCKNCVILNDKAGQIENELISGEPYKWDKFVGPICAPLGIGFDNVSKCDGFKAKRKKYVN